MYYNVFVVLKVGIVLELMSTKSRTKIEYRVTKMKCIVAVIEEKCKEEESYYFVPTFKLILAARTKEFY